MSLDATPRTERTVVVGGGLAAALRGLALAATSPERWRLPAGVLSLGETVDLGASDVEIVGVGTELHFAAGAELIGSRLALEGLILVGGPQIALTGNVALRLERISATGSLTLHGGGVTAAALTLVSASGRGLRVTGTDVLLADVRIAGVDGVMAVGIDVAAANVDLRRIVLGKIAADGTAPAGAPRVDGWIDAAGVVVQATGTITVSGLELGPLSGGHAVGARLLALGTLTVTDLAARHVSGDQSAIGLLAAAGGDLAVRGFEVSNLRAPFAEGIRVGGSGAVEVSGGRIAAVRGTEGRAAGLRVLVPPPTAAAQTVEVRDLRVENVGRAAPPASVGADEPEEPLVPTLFNEAPAPAPARPPADHTTWARQLGDALRQGAPTFPEPPRPRVPDVVGIGVNAAIEAWDPGATSFPLCEVEDTIVTRVGGSALQVEASLRRVAVRRLVLWACARPGWIAGEEVLLAECTAHLHAAALGLGPGSFYLYNTLVTGVAPGIERAAEFPDDVEVVAAAAVYAEGFDARMRPLATFPYVHAGPDTLPARVGLGEVPPAATVDLALLPASALRPVPIPEDELPPQLGGVPARALPGCKLQDPDPPALPPHPEAPDPSAIADYLARDFTAFRALLLARADQVMPGWTERGSPDLTTMLFELVADRLDLLAQAQEAAIQEAWLDTARLRRSVEDHARQLGYVPDAGLSASVMLRFYLDDAALGPDIAPAALRAADGTVTVPAGTLVSLGSHRDGAVVFATDEALVLVDDLDVLVLTEDVPRGATSAEVRPVLHGAHLARGRWLVLYDPASRDGHVVRSTVVEPGVEGTVIHWDPRRPSPRLFPRSSSQIFGNVVPAQHGIPLAPGGVDPLRPTQPDALFGTWNALLDLEIDGTTTRELRLPVGPVAVQSRGWPIPGELRRGAPAIAVEIDGERWSRAEELATARAGEEVWVLRNDDEEPLLRFGDGDNGEGLPRRPVPLRLSCRIGLGRAGNVGAGLLTNLLRLGAERADEEGLCDRLLALEAVEPASDIAARWLRVENPLAATGGRDPEPLDRVRMHAPLAVDDLRSAVTAADYETLLAAMPEVAAVRARVERRLPRPLVRLTLLLRDEDTLALAERLRRWSRVRARLDDIRLIGTDVEIVPPDPVPLDLDVVVDALDHAPAAALGREVEAALRGNGGFFDPDRRGLGADVHLSDLYRAVLEVPGVARARIQRFRKLTLGAPDALPEGVIPIGPTELPRIHGRSAADGLLTVQVCGGRR